MKKAICLLLCALLGCLCACGEGASPESGEGEAALVKEPPALTVSSGENSVEAGRGTCSWSFEENGEGKGVNADSPSPLEWEDERFPRLEGEETAELSWDGPAPDSVTVQCWPESDRGNPSAPGEEVPLEGSGFSLNEGGWVYEIQAAWDSSEDWGGQAWYAVLIQA